MKSSLGEVVCEVVARHVGAAPSTISERQTVQHDLELDPLDLVLIALRLEEIEGIEFPIARLEDVRTVGDLTAIVHAVHAANFRAALRSAEPHPSGVQVIDLRLRRRSA